MAIRLHRAYSPGTRSRVSLFLGELKIKNSNPVEPVKSLIVGKKRCGGRNNCGKITLRGRGGGHKRKYRIIDFQRKEKIDYEYVQSVEYDPNRNAHIATVCDVDFNRKYIIAPRSIEKGFKYIFSGVNSFPQIGCSLPLECIPLGSIVHNIELTLGKGAQLARAAGTYGQLIAKENNFVTLKLPSKEIRLVNKKCYATLGQVGNVDFFNIKLGKAGRKRWLGKRPKVRGVVKNPVDHPHGGGEGRSPIGHSKPLTPWGKPALGMKTRKSNKASSCYILRPRR